MYATKTPAFIRGWALLQLLYVCICSVLSSLSFQVCFAFLPHYSSITEKPLHDNDRENYYYSNDDYSGNGNTLSTFHHISKQGTHTAFHTVHREISCFGGIWYARYLLSEGCEFSDNSQYHSPTFRNFCLRVVTFVAQEYAPYDCWWYYLLYDPCSKLVAQFARVIDSLYFYMLYLLFSFEPIHLYNKIGYKKVTSWVIFSRFSSDILLRY